MKIDNFNLLEDRYIEQEQSHAYVYEHQITKAKVLVLKNEDDNRLFSIGFRTPPPNSTGVCHILEHCVLNGSKKYRTREPFMDMVKSSLQTFLNAMTYPDKTIYPVASRNTKDFENLMDVYLDAVFNPIVKERKEVFLQEGWRYHLNDDDTIEYKGVVYNEMKGAMSSEEDQVFDSIYEHLYPDNIYSLNSGGDPYEMTELSYEDFLTFYNDYYHPSNSYIFLYGNVDEKKYLEYIHNEYLSNYEYREVNSSIKLQEAFDETKRVEDFFSTTKKEKENANMVSYSVVTKSCDDSYDRLMNKILRSALINSESSPIKLAINELDIVEDLLSASSSARQLSFAILGKNIAEKNVDLFVGTIEKELKRIVENGIDENLIKSVLNTMNFSLKEKNDNPTKGIEYLSNAFSTWLYDISPIDGIDFSDTLDYINDNLGNGIFEKYIKENILDNPHKLVVVHKPKFGLNDLKDEAVNESLKNLADSLGDQEKITLKKQRENMEKFQNKEDTPEDKKTIPTLELDDVNSKFDPINREIIEKSNHTFITHNLPTAGIDYINFVFDINHIEKSDLPYVSLLTDVIGLIDTKNYDYQTLFNKIYIETGGVSITMGSYEKENEAFLNRIVTMSTKIFSENIENATEILKELLFNTLFTNEKRLKELINIFYSRIEMNLLDYAHQIMINRVNSHNFASNNFNEMTSGIDAYLFYKEILNADLSTLLSRLESLYDRVFNANNLIVNLTSDFTNKEALFSNLGEIIESLNQEALETLPYEFERNTTKEGFIASTDVSYVSIGNDLGRFGYEYEGNATVISNILSNAYLYNEIRAKGGAYGAGMVINNKNAFATYSYRDPNITNTIDVYRNIPSFMRAFEISDEDLKPFIIGAIGRFDPAQTEKSKGLKDLDMYLRNKSYKTMEENVEQAKNTNLDQLKELSLTLDKAIKDMSLSVLSNRNNIESNKELFDNIIDLTWYQKYKIKIPVQSFNPELELIFIFKSLFCTK